MKINLQRQNADQGLPDDRVVDMEGQELKKIWGNDEYFHYLAYYHGFIGEIDDIKTYEITYFNHVQFLTCQLYLNITLGNGVLSC